MNKILEMFNDKKYTRLALENHKKYIKNKPFPHIYLDNFLPKKIAAALSKEYPKINDINKNWKVHKNKNVIRYFLEDSSKYKKNLQTFSMLLNSRKFMLFLETLTGIESIVADPFFMGGGAMTTGSGGFLNVHADFNFHHKLQSWRRINALFYLTPSWKKKWGGNLELWDKNNKKKITEIEPLFNRVVIFNTTSNSFHGQPIPIKSPTNIFRNVFSVFYYSNTKDKQTLSKPHFTRYSIDNNPYAKKISEDYKKDIY
jgi:Rps23 Pro-64 3,4-dihydroxylase Tpa1-like proline 4-hydroxylase